VFSLFNNRPGEGNMILLLNLCRQRECALIDACQSAFEWRSLTAMPNTFDNYTAIVAVVDRATKQLVERIRELTKAPLLVVTMTAKVVQDVVSCLNAGADDVIDGTMASIDLIQQIMKAKIRLTDRTLPIATKVGDLWIGDNDNQIHYQGKMVELRPVESELIRHLMKHINNTVTKTALHGVMCDYTRTETGIKIVDVVICKLRQKLATLTDTFQIGTVWGVGYKLRRK
jgi:DNA-binding response OmpR family regulator